MRYTQAACNRPDMNEITMKCLALDDDGEKKCGRDEQIKAES